MDEKVEIKRCNNKVSSVISRLKDNLYLRFIYTNDQEVLQKAHSTVFFAFGRLKNLIPQNYERAELVDIVRPKASAFYTGCESLFEQYTFLKQFIHRIMPNSLIAGGLAFKLISKIGRRRQLLFSSLGEERPEVLLPSSDKDTPGQFRKDRRYNIFFASTPTYFRVLALFINEDPNDNNIIIVPKCFSDAKILKEIDQTRLLFFDDFVTPEILDKYELSKRDFKEVFEKHQAELDHIFTFDGRRFFPILRPAIENVFNRIFPQAYLFYLVVENILKAIPVRSVIGARVRKLFDRAFYVCAKHSSIKRFVLFHGNTGSTGHCIQQMGHFNDMDGIFAWGEMQKSAIESDLLSRNNKIYITGSFLFETKNRATQRKSNKTRILYAAAKNDLEEIELLVKGLRPFKNSTEIIIKAHPGVDEAPYRKFCVNSNVRLIPVTEILEHYLQDADIMVTSYSGTHLLAMRYGIPVLFIASKPVVAIDLLNLYTIGRGQTRILVARNRKDITRFFKHLLGSDEYRRNYLKVQQDYLDKIIYFAQDPDYSLKKISEIINR